jgi:dihydroxyacetone kinase-like protein
MSDLVKEIFAAWDQLFSENFDRLTQLDSVGGDGDLGVVMKDGFSAVNDFVKSSQEADVGKLFYQAGKVFNAKASSSMGTLLSSGFVNIGKQLRGKDKLLPDDVGILLNGMAVGVMNLGKAKEGEKTFLDAICPASRAYDSTDGDAQEKILAAINAAKEGVENAKNMVARQGRLAFKGENSIGITDPGTVVALIYVQGIGKAEGVHEG